MKKMKTVVFSAVVLAFIVMTTSSVQAATVFKKDGFTYKIKGDLQIQFRQDVGEDQDMDIEYDDLELKNAISYELGDNMTAFGELDFGFKNAADESDSDEDPHLEEAYLGFGVNNVEILFGKTDAPADELGIEGSKEGAGLPSDAFDAAGATGGDDLIKMKAMFEMITFMVSHEVDADSEKSDDNGTFTDLLVGGEFGDFQIAAAYQTFEADEDTDAIDIFGIHAAYDAGFAFFGADYSTAEDVESVWNVFVSVPFQTTSIGIGYVAEDFDSDEEEDLTGWYANVIYKFPSQKNVRIFAEIGGNDGEDSDVGYLFGARIKF